jgi:hypothetical protein
VGDADAAAILVDAKGNPRKADSGVTKVFPLAALARH